MKIKIFEFCEGCIGKFNRIKGNTNYCEVCSELTKKRGSKNEKN